MVKRELPSGCLFNQNDIFLTKKSGTFEKFVNYISYKIKQMYFYSKNNSQEKQKYAQKKKIKLCTMHKKWRQKIVVGKI